MIPNLVLVVLTLGLLFFATAYFRNLTKVKILVDNRFLTMEWQLLQELKAETDLQLSRKDRELDEMRVRYSLLKMQNMSPAEIGQLQQDILKAEKERETIQENLFSAGTANTSIAPSADFSVPQTLGADLGSALYRKRIRDLEEQIAIITKNDAARDGANNVSPVTHSVSSIDSTRELRLFLEQKIRELDQSATPQFEDLKTRTLLRAIASSPAIRADYPDLLEKTDLFLESYAKQEQLKGKKQAYSELLGEISRGY